MNLVKGEVADGRLTTLSGRLVLGLPAAVAAKATGTEPVTAGIRAEDITVGADGDVEAKVHDIENHGVELIVTLRVDGHLLKVTTPATLKLAVEDNVRFSWNPDKVHVFGADGISLAYR
jgi:multiple sugar transport system ATP-binding protein